MRPLIGLTAHAEPASWGLWRDRPATLLPQAYLHHVDAAGGLPVVVPPLSIAAASDAAAVLARLDGLLIIGGPDIDPARYGAAPDPRTGPVRPERDAGELALLAAALDRDLPVLGICRGMELLTVGAGGRLHQHLPDVVGHDRHAPEPATYGRHPVRIAPDTLLGRVLGDRAEVASYHHQGVAEPGTLTVSAWAPDGVVEGVESPGHRFVLGVLWHPELDEDGRLFEALVRAARSA